jgi:hypothetical protein
MQFPSFALRDLQERGAREYISSYFIALIHAGPGETYPPRGIIHQISLRGVAQAGDTVSFDEAAVIGGPGSIANSPSRSADEL